MYSYTFGSGAAATRIPKTFYIVGSNDGTNWYPLQTASFGATNPFTTIYTTATNYIIVNQAGTQNVVQGTTGVLTVTLTSNYATNSYTYFRFVITTTFGDTLVELGEWYINFNAGGQSYSTNFGSTWQNGYALATPSALSLSGSGQYALAANTTTILSELNFENTTTDVLSYLAFSNSLGIAYSSTAKVGSYSLNLTNPSSGALTSYVNYSLTPTTFPILTISFWLYTTSVLTCSVLGFNNGASTPGPDFGINGSGQLLWAFYTTGSTTGALVGAGSAIVANAWNHVAITFNSSTSTTQYYFNGASVGSSAITGSLSLNGGGNLTNLLFGSYAVAGVPGFNGLIDDFRLYNQALTSSQVSAIYTTNAYPSSCNVVSN
jgi:hypothetical protein